MRITASLVLITLASLIGAAQAQESGDFFVQLADPQFGAITADRDFAQETVNYEFAIANINRLQPAFVVICGDLINKPGDPAQRDEYFRITAGLDEAIRLYAVAGNHDIGNEPTPESIAEYRQHFGADYYSFEDSGVYGIVLNSTLIAAPQGAPAEAAAQEAWLVLELERARASDANHIVVFQHHSWFIESADEPDNYFNIPAVQRNRYLTMLRDAGVRYVFAGHYHQNAYATDGELEMITSGPVGRPLGEDPSGLRIVEIGADGLAHTYYAFGLIPNQL